jgi:hypothetical protein
MVAEQQTLPSNQKSARNGVRIKSIALPAEHGGWGFVCEPMVLGLLLAPSIAGFYLALSAVGFFLARHPLTLVVLNRRRESPRTALAKRFAAIYLAIGAASFIAALIFTQRIFIFPLLVAAPFAFVQLAYDWTGNRRVLLSEVSGAIAISSLAAMIALSAGLPKPLSFALWAIMIARAVPAILYVRAIIARLHRQSSSALPMLLAHAAAVFAMGFLYQGGLAPFLAVVVMLVLLLRASIVFAFAKPNRVTAKQLGFSEIAFGAVTVFAIALGNAFGM